MSDLKEDYLDDVLDVTKNTKRRYRMIQNEDGTVSFEDVTDYSQIGDSFGAKDVNAINEAINGLSETIGYSSKNLLDCSGLTEQTINDVTFTPVYDSNGLLEYINVNGTSIGIAEYKLGTYHYTNGDILSGCPKGGNISTYKLFASNGPSQSTDIGEGTTITLESYGLETASIYIGLKLGITADNLRFYPMIRKAEIEDPTYEPYYKVEGLRDKVATLEEYISNLTNGNEVLY